jgi:hypothetical protein
MSGTRWNRELAYRAADPHFLPVIVELFAAIEAHNVSAIPGTL